MQVDRPGHGEDPLAARDHRVRSQPPADRNTPAGQVAPGELPLDHGVLAVTAARLGRLRDAADQDDRTRQARRRLLRRLARGLGLGADVELTVEVDPGSGAVRFVVRDRHSGAARGELSEAELQAQWNRRPEPPGSLCDRRL